MAVRNHTLAALVSSQICSAVGSSVSAFGASIWVFQETGSATLLAIMFLASLAPGALVGMWAGGVVDRVARRRVMLAADTVAAVATAVGVALFTVGVLAWWHVVVIAVVISVASAFQEPAYLAALPSLATAKTLPRVNGAVQIGPALAMVIGPALGGTLVATLGLGAAFALDLLSFAVAVIVLARVRFPGQLDGQTVRTPTPQRRDVRAGWEEVRRRPGLLALTLLAAGLNFFLGFVNVLLLPLILGFATAGLAGAALGAGGLGMLVGSVTMSASRGTRRHASAIAVGIGVLGSATVALSLTPSIVVVALSLAVLMACVPVVSASAQTLAQLAVPDHVRGRVFGIRRALATAAMPASYLLAGPLAESVFEPAMVPGGWAAGALGPVIGTGSGRGIAALFLLCGLGVVSVAIATYRSRSLRQLEADALAATDEPTTPSGNGSTDASVVQARTAVPSVR